MSVAKAHKAMLDRLTEVAQAAFDANHDARRCETPFVGAAGECLACGADQGVACRKSLYTSSPTQERRSERKP